MRLINACRVTGTVTATRDKCLFNFPLYLYSNNIPPKNAFTLQTRVTVFLEAPYPKLVDLKAFF